MLFIFFFQAEDGIRDHCVTGVQTCALPILGAGKTTFIRALCAAKNVKETVGSPTFSIINEYGYPGGTLFHLDLYRLKDEEEALRAGVEDCLYSGEICLVEWPDRAPGIFPDSSLVITLENLDENTRKMRIPSVLGKNSG